MNIRRALPIGLACLAFASTSFAVPGPDSVFVVANSTLPESVTLAQQYAAARNIPDRQVCMVSLPDETDISLDDYRTMFLMPVQQCLMSAGVLDRIEAAVLVKGIPLRVDIPTAAGSGTTQTASLAAALGVWQSTMVTGGGAFLGQQPGQNLTCTGGSTCYGAQWNNPFTNGVFTPGWTASEQGVSWAPILVTMLDGRSYSDAALLIQSAITGEQMGGARGEFLFMDGADSARGALDVEYPEVIAQLATDGFTNAHEVPFANDLTGLSLAAFFTGTSSLGMTIEGNTYLPGSIVDNLTSYGAEPVNFAPTGESQVSIARWVAMGVAGVEGTVDEPLSNAFPSRGLVNEYTEGSTLGESYMRAMPFVYWRNLVVGDVMAAPYATRPVVTLMGVTDGAMVSGAREVTATATDATGRAFASITLFVDGVQVATAMGATVTSCVTPAAGGSRQILAVAQIADDSSAAHSWQPKGWTSLHVNAVAGPMTCSAADAGMPSSDGGADASTRSADGAMGPDAGGGSHGGGCGCRTTGGHRSGLPASLVALMLACAGLRGRRRRDSLSERA